MSDREAPPKPDWSGVTGATAGEKGGVGGGGGGAESEKGYT